MRKLEQVTCKGYHILTKIELKNIAPDNVAMVVAEFFEQDIEDIDFTKLIKEGWLEVCQDGIVIFQDCSKNDCNECKGGK